MRSLALAPFLFSVSGLAQDAATQAAIQANQQAMQASQQASQEAIQASQQASQQATQATQQAMQDAQTNFNNSSCLASRPKFSLKPGAYTGTQTVFLEAKDRHARIFYTTDGWTPTDQSMRYAGPVTLNSTTQLKAVAFAPGCWRSQVAEAEYTFPGRPAVLPVAVGTDGVLRQGTEFHLTFVTPVSSAKARIGDPIDLTVATPLTLGGREIAPGTLKAAAVVTEVGRPSAFGGPGDVTFVLRSMTVEGVTVPLTGEETAEGADKIDQVRHRIFIPVVGGFSALATHGENAQIAPGALVTGRVTADVRLPASVSQTTTP